MPPAASTSNPSRFLTPFGLQPASPQLQRPIRHGFLLLLDFCHASRSFNVQSTTISCSFWTSAMPPAASMSNPPRFLAPFGFLPCFPQLQRPICHAFLLLLDLCLLPHSFNVQSTTVSYSFWTSAMPPAALTSNPPRFLAPFGFLPCFPQLQRPICHAFLLLLDLCLLPHSFNVQSVTLSCSFWTSACFPAALTSNPSRFLAPFGLLPCLPQLQRPIRHDFLLFLDFHMPPATSTSNPPRIQATLASPQPQALHNAKKQHQHISASIALYLLILF